MIAKCYEQDNCLAPILQDIWNLQFRAHTLTNTFRKHFIAVWYYLRHMCTYKRPPSVGAWLLSVQQGIRFDSMVDHDDVIKWKHFPRYWSFVRGIHRSPVNSPHKGQWRGALMFSLICAWINDWVNNGEAGDLRRHRTHDDVIVMTVIWKDQWIPITKGL